MFEKKVKRHRGIMTTIGGFFILCSLSNMYIGFINVYEASFLYWKGSQNDKVFTWVNFSMTVSNFMTQFAFLCLLGYTIRLGERLSIFVFGLLNIISTLLTPFIESIWLYELNAGMLQGLAMGSAYLVPMIIAWTYFPGKRGTVTGLIMMGLSASPYITGMMIPHIVNPHKALPTVNIPAGSSFSDALMHLYSEDIAENVPRTYYSIAAIQAVYLLIGMVFLRAPYLPPGVKKINTKSTMGRIEQHPLEPTHELVPQDNPISSIVESPAPFVRMAKLSMRGASGSARKSHARMSTARGSMAKAANLRISNVRMSNVKMSNANKKAPSSKKSMKKSLVASILSVRSSFGEAQINFWRRVFCSFDLIPLVLVITLSVQFPCFMNVNFMVFGSKLQLDSEFTSTIGSFSFLVSVAGKLIVGILYDKLGYRMAFYLVLVMQVVITLLIYHISWSKFGFAVSMFVIYFVYGAHLGLYPTISQKLFGVNNGPKAFGIIIFGMNLANLIGGAGSSFLIGYFGWEHVFVYFFFCTIISTVLLCLYRPKIKDFREVFEEKFDPTQG